MLDHAKGVALASKISMTSNYFRSQLTFTPGNISQAQLLGLAITCAGKKLFK